MTHEIVAVNTLDDATFRGSIRHVLMVIRRVLFLNDLGLLQLQFVLVGDEGGLRLRRVARLEVLVIAADIQRGALRCAPAFILRQSECQIPSA